MHYTPDTNPYGRNSRAEEERIAEDADHEARSDAFATADAAADDRAALFAFAHAHDFDDTDALVSIAARIAQIRDEARALRG